MEVALFGEAYPAEGVNERLTRIEAIFRAEIARPNPPQLRIRQILQGVHFGAVVNLPPKPNSSSDRFAAFAPMVFVGVFGSKQAALDALEPWILYSTGSSSRPPVSTFGEDGMSGFPVGGLPALNYIEFAMLALHIARHDRPASDAGVPVTTPEEYQSTQKVVIPRTKLPRVYAASFNDEGKVVRLAIGPT
jgi:hypothetical protein